MALMGTSTQQGSPTSILQARLTLAFALHCLVTGVSSVDELKACFLALLFHADRTNNSRLQKSAWIRLFNAV